MDITEKYGKTNTVAKICAAHGVPLEHGFVLADFVTHGRVTFWTGEALRWFNEKYGETEQTFSRELGELGRWMRDQWTNDAR